MKKIWRRYSFIIITVTTILIVYSSFYYKSDDKGFIAIVISITGIYLGLLKYRMENDKMFKDLFDNFTNKYDEKFNELFNDLRSGAKKELSNDDKNLIIDYFNLSAEEFLWFTKGRIPEQVWEAWESGIQENLKLPKIKELFEAETQTEDAIKSFYGLVERLKTKT